MLIRRFVAATMVAGCAALPATGAAIEEPAYHVVQRLGQVELRDYPARVVAEVRVPGPAEAAGRQGFPALARYIFGANKDERQMPMTAPVALMAASAPDAAAFSLVSADGAADRPYRVQFMLPAEVTVDAAPAPLDARVQVRAEPAARFAVLRYNGFWSEANDAEHLSLLQAALREAHITWSGNPVVARYDAPYVPWFMRRNEVWLQVP